MSSISNMLLVTSEERGIMAVMAGMMIFILVIAALAYVISSLSISKLLQKAGQPGWPGWVPYYNIWRLFEISGKPGALALIFLGAFIPFLGFFVAIGMSIFLGLTVAKVFNKSAGFGVGLGLLGIVFYPILAFGDSQYVGPQVQQGFPVGPRQ